MEQEEYSETTGSLARAVPCLPQLVRKYSDAGLVEFKRLSDGTRVYRPSAATRVREILAERLARRGGNRRGPAAA
jgi:hypothetical protein